MVQRLDSEERRRQDDGDWRERLQHLDERHGQPEVSRAHGCHSRQVSRVAEDERAREQDTDRQNRLEVDFALPVSYHEPRNNAQSSGSGQVRP